MKLLVSLIACLVTLVWVMPAGAQRFDDCSDFANWREAQDHFDRAPEARRKFDPDSDGVACESLLWEGLARLKEEYEGDSNVFWKQPFFWLFVAPFAFVALLIVIAVFFDHTPSLPEPEAGVSGLTSAHPATWESSPKGLRVMPYDDYLQTQHWKSVRKRTFAMQEHLCAECGRTTNLQVHHLTYARRGAERNEDLQVLCRTCHMKRHRLL